MTSNIVEAGEEGQDWYTWYEQQQQQNDEATQWVEPEGTQQDDEDVPPDQQDVLEDGIDYQDAYAYQQEDDDPDAQYTSDTVAAQTAPDSAEPSWVWGDGEDAGSQQSSE
jgi:hypothetical protein